MEKGEVGLTSREASRQLEKFGKNILVEEEKISFLKITKEEITEPMILLLIFVGVLYSIWGKLTDSITIFSLISLLIAVEVWNEYRAKKAISALSEITALKTKVLRDNKIIEIDSKDVVPGDVLILIQGTKIAADAKLISFHSLQIDEASMTGESFPVDKKINEELYAGTIVVEGEGKAIVISTGKNTKLGNISSIAQKVKPPRTPLQLGVSALSKKLVWVSIFFSIFIPLIGVLRGNDLKTMILTGLSLAFATIPEELPMVITLVLAIGSYTLSKQKFLVKKLKATEVLGNSTVIVTDKTGTITETKMSIASILPKAREKEVIATAIEAFTEISLSPLDKAISAKASQFKLAEIGEILRERNFGNGRKTKTIIRENKGRFEMFVSGAPEEVFSMSKNKNKEIIKNIEEETNNGRRVIAVARRTISSRQKDFSFKQLEKDLEFVGIISFEDPAREGVKETIEQLKQAGVRTIMVTGDHPQTASYIAKSVSIDSGKVITGEQLDKISDEQLKELVKTISIFARATPEHKYRIVKALQENGEIVSVTGDGVNDSIALREANIGIAMGIRGTDSAKEQADAVLADDNYITISKALFQGRVFYDNIRKAIKYDLSIKTALVLVLLLPVFFDFAFPFSPIQIIVLELFMDLAASSAFIAEPAEKSVYTRKPEREEKFFNKKMITGIFTSGFSLFLAVLISYLYAQSQGFSIIQIQTFTFSTWVIGHIFLALVVRSEQSILKVNFFSNKLILLWILATIILLLVVLNIPFFRTELNLASLSIAQLGTITGITFVSIFWQEILKLFKKNN